MNRSLALVAALAFLFACAQKKQTVETKQTPSDPTGAIVGIVTSLRTGQPLSGVGVTVPTPGGAVSAVTDTHGAYSLGGLVAGATYLVRFSAPGHVTGLGDATIPNTAGNYPSDGIAQLDMALAESSSKLNGHVYARDGAPAMGVVLMVDLRPQGFDLVATATTDSQGAYSLTGLPGAPTGLSFTVVAQPWDSNGDGIADYNALSRTAVTYPGATSLLDFDLRLAVAQLLLLTSNVESGTLGATTPIQLTFNRALDANLTTVSLYDSTTLAFVAVTTSLDTTSQILTVVPSGTSTLAPFHNYSLTVDALATNGATLVVTRAFTAVVPVSSLAAVTGLTVNPAAADYDTRSFSLSWNAVPDASGYQVWVRDTSRNPDWLLMGTVGSTPTPTFSPLTLPGTFDYYSADGIQTPFAYGVKVDFAVVPTNAAGDAPLPSTATPVRRSDTVPPLVLNAVQSGSAYNTTGSAATITLALTFSEYMDTSVIPTIALPVASETATFQWNANLRSGVFTITIPAATDGSGSYTVSGLKDTSGNAKTYSGTLRKLVQLVQNGDFEAGTLTGWTTSFTSTSTAPVISTAFYTSGSYSAQIGNATVSVQSGYSTLQQDVALPSSAASITFSARYRPYTSSYYSYDWNECLLQDTSGTTLATLFRSYSGSTWFSSATADLTSRAGTTVRITCRTYQSGYYVSGMYLDDVSILSWQ